MEIKNEEHARKIIEQWCEKPVPAQKREFRLAIEKLELNAMYYEQKGNDRGVKRAECCIRILNEHLQTLE